MKHGPRHYWDGGIVDNTPLGDAIDAFSVGDDVKRILVVMNLFPQTARLPGSLLEVTERVDQLRFGNRVRQDTKTAQRVNDLITTIDELAKLVSGDLPPKIAAGVRKARAYKYVQTVEISLGPTSEGLRRVRLSRLLARGDRTPQDRRPRHGAGEAPLRARIATSQRNG